VRRARIAIVAVVALLIGVALTAMISLRVSAEPVTVPHPTLPAQGGVAPLLPEPTVAPNQPKTHATTSTTRAQAPAVSGNEDWTSGQPQQHLASDVYGQFGVRC